MTKTRTIQITTEHIPAHGNNHQGYIVLEASVGFRVIISKARGRWYLRFVTPDRDAPSRYLWHFPTAIAAVRTARRWLQRRALKGV